MSRKLTIVGAAATVVTFACAGTLDAQRASPRSTLASATATDIVARLGRNETAAWFIDILRQTEGAQPHAKLDELADSLADRAIGARDGDQPDSARAARATAPMIALTLAGNAASKTGTPYDGAVERLIRIHHESSVLKVRSQALAMLPAVVGRTRSIPYLTQIATSSDGTAFNAVSVLITDAAGGTWAGAAPTVAEQDETNAVLQRLATEHLVTDPLALAVLDRWAATARRKPPR